MFTPAVCTRYLVFLQSRIFVADVPHAHFRIVGFATFGAARIEMAISGTIAEIVASHTLRDITVDSRFSFVRKLITL